MTPALPRSPSAPLSQTHRCMLCRSPLPIQDTSRESLGADPYSICEDCRLDNSLPQESVGTRDPSFPHTPHLGMHVARKVAIELVLPVAYREEWSIAQLREVTGVSENTAKRSLRQFGINQLKQALAMGRVNEATKIIAQTHQEALALRLRSLNLGTRSVTVAEGLLERVEARLLEAQDKEGDQNDPYARPLDKKEVDNLAQDAKVLKSVIGSLKQAHELAMEASGMKAAEKAQTAKAGAPTIGSISNTVMHVTNVSGARPAVTLAMRPGQPEVIEA